MNIVPSTVSMLENRLVAGLPQSVWTVLRADVSWSRLVPGQILLERGQLAEHVYFLEEGIVSLMAEPAMGGRSVQVAMVGREGMVGGLSLLGEHRALADAVVHVPGPALRVPIQALQQRIQECAALGRACMDSVQELTRQIVESAACNARCSLTERCIRWLLMVHERLDGDDLPITHEAMATMLGVRRSGVTQSIAALQVQGLVRTRRGSIRILDRSSLEDAVGRVWPGPKGSIGNRCASTPLKLPV